MKRLTLILLFAAGCSEEETPLTSTQKAVVERAEARAKTHEREASTFVPGGRVETFTHDRHLFVMGYNLSGAISITHHPGCPCLRLPAGGFVPLEQEP